MPPETYRYGGGAADTTLHPAVALAMLLALVCLIALPRRHASLPVLWMTLLVPLDQQIYIAGLHLFVLRLVIGVGFLRAWRSGKMGPLNGIDRAFLICCLAQAVAPILLFREGQTVVYELGYLWDWVGGYFLFRWLIQDEEDMRQALRYTAILLVPVALGMMVEQWKVYNMFSVLGGLPSAPSIREGKVRAQGVFEHSLTAGFLAAVIAPLFLILWKSGKSKGTALIGTIASTLMMWASNSSTTYLTYAAAVVGIAAWPLRKNMQKVRWAIAAALIGLHLVMKAPVWFILARVDVTGGSSGYHRAALVDACIRNFTDWWLIGTNNNVHWGLDMFDIQNQYVNVAQVGGLVALVCFILMISRGFGQIGEAMKRCMGDRRRMWALWLLGCSLFANVVGFFGVNYFDQSRMAWLMLFSMILACTATARQTPGKAEAIRQTEEGDPVCQTRADGWFGSVEVGSKS